VVMLCGLGPLLVNGYIVWFGTIVTGFILWFLISVGLLSCYVLWEQCLVSGYIFWFLNSVGQWLYCVVFNGVCHCLYCVV
jgi:hypothetical protein